jgi:hypothetical protein
LISYRIPKRHRQRCRPPLAALHRRPCGEISIGPAGVTSMILFDDGGDRERVLLQIGS